MRSNKLGHISILLSMTYMSNVIQHGKKVQKVELFTKVAWSHAEYNTIKFCADFGELAMEPKMAAKMAADNMQILQNSHKIMYTTCYVGLCVVENPFRISFNRFKARLISSGPKHNFILFQYGHQNVYFIDMLNCVNHKCRCAI